MTQAPGRGLLKVTGIIYIILSALGLIGTLMTLAGGGLLAATGAPMGAVLGVVFIVAAIISLAQGVFGLIMGILGVQNCDKPEKAGTCFVLGMIVVVLGAIGLVGNLLGRADGATIFGNLLGLVIPVLYTVGAYKNKEFAQSM